MGHILFILYAVGVQFSYNTVCGTYEPDGMYGGTQKQDSVQFNGLISPSFFCTEFNLVASKYFNRILFSYIKSPIFISWSNFIANYCDGNELWTLHYGLYGFDHTINKYNLAANLINKKKRKQSNRLCCLLQTIRYIIISWIAIFIKRLQHIQQIVSNVCRISDRPASLHPIF